MTTIENELRKAKEVIREASRLGYDDEIAEMAADHLASVWGRIRDDVWSRVPVIVAVAVTFVLIVLL